MRHAKRRKPARETMQAPWTAVVRVTGKDGTVYDPGDKVPDSVVKSNRWLIDAGRVSGTPKAKGKK